MDSKRKTASTKGNTTKSKRKSPKRRSKQLINVGDIYPTKTSGDIEIIEEKWVGKKKPEFVVRFVDTGSTFQQSIQKIISGMIVDPKSAKVEVGGVYPTNRVGDVRVLQTLGHENVEVEFLGSGYVKVVATKELLSGRLRDESYKTLKDDTGPTVRAIDKEGYVYDYESPQEAIEATNIGLDIFLNSVRHKTMVEGQLKVDDNPIDKEFLFELE